MPVLFSSLETRPDGIIVVHLQAVVELDADTIGDWHRVVQPGDSAYGLTYAEWRSRAPGRVEVGEWAKVKES